MGERGLNLEAEALQFGAKAATVTVSRADANPLWRHGRRPRANGWRPKAAARLRSRAGLPREFLLLIISEVIDYCPVSRQDRAIEPMRRA